MGFKKSGEPVMQSFNPLSDSKNRNLNGDPLLPYCVGFDTAYNVYNMGENQHCYLANEPSLILQTEMLLASILINLEFLCATMDPSTKNSKLVASIPFWQLVIAAISLLTLCVICVLLIAYLLR